MLKKLTTASCPASCWRWPFRPRPRPPRPSTGSRTARRPIRSGPTSSPAPSSGRRTPATPSTPRSTTATCRRSRRRCARRSPPRPTASSPPAPIRAAWSRSSRRRTPPTSRSSTSTRPTRRRASTPMSAATTSSFGKHWAQYLVDKGLVKSGDFVWMPVEVPGATYGVAGRRRHHERLQAARHHLGGHRSDARPGRGHHPHGRLPHRQPGQDQGDHRPRRPRHRLRSSASSTRSASSPAKSRSSAGATRSTPPRKC